MSTHLTPNQRVDIINSYTVNLETMISLAKRHGITRQGVHKVLKQARVDTSKHRIEVSCTCCGLPVLKDKCRIRARKRLFCSQECYYAYLEASQGSSYKAWRHGQRIARAKVAQVFDLKDNHVVHHSDRNAYNNMLNNLMVFANQGDHIRYHRLGAEYVTPIWNGEK